MDCPECGQEIEDASRFCRFCGEELPKLPEDFDLKTELQSMDNYDFEHFVADLWEEMGWNCNVSTASNDKGIDVRATKESPYSQKTLIQAKRYSQGNKVGSPDIQQYASLKHQEDSVDKVVMVTTSSYSKSAEELANDLNVKLIDGDDLVALIDDLDAEQLVEAYLDLVPDASKESPEESTPDVEDLEPDELVSAEKPPAAHSYAEPVTKEPVDDSEGTSENLEIDLPSGKWHTTIKATIVTWIASFVVGPVAPALGGLLILVAYFGLPVAIYMDSRETRKVVVWPRFRKTYIASAFMFGPLTAVWYLLLRLGIQQGKADIELVNDSDEETGGEETEFSADDIDIQVSLHGPGIARGRDYEFEHHSDALGKIQDLKDSGRDQELEQLLHWCISETESESKRSDVGVVPHYYEEVAKLYRKYDRYEEEIAVLEQFAEQDHAPGKKPQKLLERLGRVRQLAKAE